MTDYKAHLLDMISNVISGFWTVEKFRSKFYDYYLEEVPEEGMHEYDYNFFGMVQQKLDWTDRIPDNESRSVGWVDESEFITWLSNLLINYKEKRE
jgi:hypothetical protein